MIDDGLRLGVGDAARAPVGDDATGSEGGEIAAGGHIARLELEVEARRRERAAAELELLRVVAEEAEVARSRARRDAGADRLAEARDPLGREPVEVRRDGLLELGAVFGIGVATETVHHDEQDLGVGRLDQIGQIHAFPLSALRAGPLGHGSLLRRSER